MKRTSADAHNNVPRNTAVTVDEALRLMDATPHITPEVNALLATELPGISSSVREIAAMHPLVLASKLIGMPGVQESDLLVIARELTASWVKMLAGTGSPAAQSPGAKLLRGNQPVSPTAPTAPTAPAALGCDCDSPVHDEMYYRDLLTSVSQGRVHTMSGDARYGAVVITAFNSMSGDVHLDGTVILKNSSTMSGNITGNAHVPPGVQLTSMSGDVTVDVHVKTYEELARQIGRA